MILILTRNLAENCITKDYGTNLWWASNVSDDYKILFFIR